MIDHEYDNITGVWFVDCFGERHEFSTEQQAKDYASECNNWMFEDPPYVLES